MLPNKSTLILIFTLTAIGLIKNTCARVPRQYSNEPRNVSSYTYGGYYGGRNKPMVNDRPIDDDEEEIDDLADEKDSPYLWVSLTVIYCFSTANHVSNDRIVKNIQIQFSSHHFVGTNIHPTFVILMTF